MTQQSTNATSAQHHLHIPWRLLVRSLRPHQWLKNLLIALPIISAHEFTWRSLQILILAFTAFSLCASAVYLSNDIIDRKHDSRHESKVKRPIASGAVSGFHALAAAGVLLFGALIVSLYVSVWFSLVLLGYLIISLSYSVWLKRFIMIDVVILACLYGLRVVAGGVATSISLSEWLIAFCIFLFLSLALIKRITELKGLPNESRVHGRGYTTEDTNTLQALAGGAGMVSVLVLALYLNSTEVRVLYSYPNGLWGVGLILIYWIGRVIIITGRGEMHEDPIVFAVTDRISIIAAILAAVLILVSS